MTRKRRKPPSRAGCWSGRITWKVTAARLECHDCRLTRLLSGYQKRWFVLSNGVLSYYRWVELSSSFPTCPPSPREFIWKSFPDGAYIYLVRLVMMCLCNYTLFTIFPLELLLSESYTYTNTHISFIATFSSVFFSSSYDFILRSIAFSCPWLGVLVYRQTTSLHVLHHNMFMWSWSWFIVSYTNRWRGNRSDKNAASYRLASLSNPLFPDTGCGRKTSARLKCLYFAARLLLIGNDLIDRRIGGRLTTKSHGKRISSHQLGIRRLLILKRASPTLGECLCK